ncbi:MAG TPA: histidine kinase [Steroidobacteraceae bacterium]|nr:histidine kinase [Steroidobacteraceae bacterium]
MRFARPPASSDAKAPYMFFITRIASAYTLTLNETVIASAGVLHENGDRWSAKQPVGVTFPASLLKDENELLIKVRGDAGRRSGVAPILLGPAQEVEPLRARAYALRVGLTMAASLFSLLVASFCLLLWLQQRERLYLWACIGEVIWALVVADVVLEWTPLQWPAWGLALLMIRIVWVWALYIIIEQVFGLRPRRERFAMKVIAASVPFVIAATALMNTPLPVQVWRSVASIFMTIVMVRLFISLRSSFTVERLLLVSGIAILLLAGIHDAFSSSLFSSGFGDSVWAKYVGAVLGLTIMWIVSNRFRHARTEAAQLQASLEQRVEQKEIELRESFTRLSEAERSRAVIAERERILRDMHDGVGANLATAMRQLESGTAPASDVAATLRESLDHLKLSIDAMNLPTGDVNALLASLRYRLQPRIESAGLQVFWSVDELPTWPNSSDITMRHLQFLLLEAFSNVLQHASASSLTLGAHVADGRIELTLSDNGCGFDAGAKALRSMRERANAIGATLSVENAEPGTRVRVLL